MTLRTILRTMPRTALLLIPALLMAQTPAVEVTKPAEPPADVDQALRARAKEFLQYNVEGNYRKAFEMVAEDSKDFYFGMAKPKYLSFELTAINYTDNFTKAEVKGSVKKVVMFAGREVEMPIPVSDTWEMRDGKWMWAHKESKSIETPFGTVTIDPSAKPAASAVPKDMSMDAARSAEKQLVVQTGVSKESLSFTRGKAGSDEVVFHNGLNGFVKVLATPLFDGGTVKAEPIEASVPGGKDVTLVVRYDPSAGTPINTPVLRLTVEPFNQTYYIPLTLAEAAQ
jgi:hypothetical protein